MDFVVDADLAAPSAGGYRLGIPPDEPAHMSPIAPNALCFGDNIDILPLIPPESVDLVYLDPPFNSSQTYNIFFKERDGSRAAAQLKAFEDAWEWNEQSARTYEEIVERGGAVSQALQTFRSLLGGGKLLAYLTMMAPRLAALRQVLKPTGSLYLHCDPTASHYLKILLDVVFRPSNFRSEIVWRRSNAHNKTTRQYGPIHDTILFYTKSDDFCFCPQYRPYAKGYIAAEFTGEDEFGPYRTNMLTGPGTRKGSSGMPWRGFDPTKVNRHWAIPASRTRAGRSTARRKGLMRT